MCQNTVFVDVDYPQLIARKADIITATPELYGLLSNLSRTSGIVEVPLQSENYFAVGCDLGDVGKLETLLSKQLDISQCMVLCTAEVSITYMESEPSDRLISWAANHSDSRCQLRFSMLSTSSNSRSPSALLSFGTIPPWWSGAPICRQDGPTFRKTAHSVAIDFQVP